MKATILILGSVLALSVTSCNKDECHDCHYEIVENGVETEVELGEKCGDDLENLEKDGFTDADGTTYEVHCHEH